MEKTINYYMSLPYRLEIIFDTEEGSYGVCYLELPGCIICSNTIEDIIVNAKDTKKAWIEAALEECIDIAEPQQDTDLSEFSGKFSEGTLLFHQHTPQMKYTELLKLFQHFPIHLN